MMQGKNSKGSFFRRAIFLLALAMAFSSCSRDVPIRESRIAMGTAVTLTFYNRKDAALADEAFSLLYGIEEMISFHNDVSGISEINRNAGNSPVSVPEELFSLIKRSKEISEKTEGYFNPLMGAVTSLWNIGSGNARRPGDDEIMASSALLDTDDIILDDGKSSVYLRKEGMKLDLGGIGKGYATAVLRDFLISRGVKSAIINLGGNVYAIGEKKGGREFRIGINNPEGGAYIAEADVSDQAVVTSGAYERYSDIDGVRYHHIFTSSGYPSDADLLSATIISSDPVLADALSTAVFAAGSSYAEHFSELFGAGVIVYDSSHTLRSYGL